jgi:lipoyl-dependent peroxiredoxin
MIKTATSVWNGSAKEGQGRISTESGALRDAAYSFNARFSGEKGTNPEELIGAAHAGCFNMALSVALSEAGFPPDELSTKASVSLVKKDAGYEIDAVQLDLTATVPGISQEKFDEIAQNAKANCPVSKLLRAEITLNAALKS